MAQITPAVLLFVAVGGVGLPVAAATGARLGLPVPTSASLVPLIGLIYVGVMTLALGHLGLLGRWLPAGLALGGLTATAVWRMPARELIAVTWRTAGAQTRTYPGPVAVVALAFVLAVAAAFAPPNRIDEIEYHWAAPLAWALHGGWNDSPYRHVDGFPFMEIIYTAAATQEAYVAAHLMHLATLLALGLAAGGAARSLGVRGTAPVAAAAMVMPVAWDGAYAAYSDTAVGAFCTAAVAVALGARTSLKASVVAAAVLIAVAVSIKPTAVTGVGVVGLVLLLRWLPQRKHDGPGVKELLRSWVVLALLSVATLTFWSVRQWMLTGHFVDPSFLDPPTADELTRLPSDFQQLIAPLMPFVSGIIGAEQPWGGRTSFVLQLFLIPSLAYAVWRRGDVGYRFAVLALPAWAHWAVLGIAIVRTRFHIVSWVLLVASIRVVVEDAGRDRPRLARWLEAAWTLGVFLGAVDVSFEMIRLIRDTWF